MTNFLNVGNDESLTILTMKQTISFVVCLNNHNKTLIRKRHSAMQWPAICGMIERPVTTIMIKLLYLRSLKIDQIKIVLSTKYIASILCVGFTVQMFYYTSIYMSPSISIYLSFYISKFFIEFDPI